MTDELDHWAAHMPERRMLETFLEWCDEQKYELAAWTEDSSYLQPRTESRDRLLNRYFGVNEKRLEEQRRALLEEHRERTGQV